MPKRGVAYTFNITLLSVAASGTFQANPTLEAADFRLHKDNGAGAPLTTLPVVEPAGGILVKVTLSAPEMTADRIDLVVNDAVGNEWGPLHHPISTLDEVDIADVVLTRDWTAVPIAPAAYSVWQALRALRNAWTVVSGTPPVQHVKDEGGSSDAWTRSLTTDGAAEPITGAS